MINRNKIIHIRKYKKMEEGAYINWCDEQRGRKKHLSPWRLAQPQWSESLNIDSIWFVGSAY